MSIESVRGVLLDPADAATLVDALTVFERVLNERGSRPSPKLVALHTRLSHASTDANRRNTVAGNSIAPAHGSESSSLGHEFIDSTRAATILGITTNGVRDLARRGRLPAVFAGGRWLYDAAAVTARAEHRR